MLLWGDGAINKRRIPSGAISYDIQQRRVVNGHVAPAGGGTYLSRYLSHDLGSLGGAGGIPSLAHPRPIVVAVGLVFVPCMLGLVLAWLAVQYQP